MESFKKILVPVDGSHLSEIAFEKGLSLAKLVEGEVYVVHVTEPVKLTYTGYEGAEINSAIELVENENLAGVKKYMKRFGKRSSETGIPVKVMIEKGSVQSKLVEMSSDYDLIIMGSKGRNVISTLLLGSVAEYVSRHACCPVMLIRESDEECGK